MTVGRFAGYTVSGRVIYRVVGVGVRCDCCRREMGGAALFTRGKRSVVVCRRCRPFEIERKEWRDG
jgi:hypothetical protein